jgi:hypothetical protein
MGIEPGATCTIQKPIHVIQSNVVAGSLYRHLKINDHFFNRAAAPIALIDGKS